jgi:hypothetical protein
MEGPQYAGILRAIQPPPADEWATANCDDPGQDEIDDDLEGEKETIDFQDLPGDDTAASDDEDESVDEDESEDEDGDSRMADFTAMRAVISEASKGVVDSTDAEYKR